MKQYKSCNWHCRGDELQQREEALRAQLEELTSIQTRTVQALQDASAAASSAPAAASPGQAAAPAAAAAANPVTQPAAAAASAASVPVAAAPPAQPEAQAGPSTAGNATAAGIRSPPQPALFRTPAAPPTGDAARGIAQVLEGSARTGRITSAMFGSAIQAALAAATQVRLAANA